MNEKRQAVGYVRVSTVTQACEGVSLEAQQSRLEAWCTLHGCELISLHVDAGFSGKKAANRPGLQNALDEACKAGASLVVYSLSRLARSTRDTLDIAERLDRSGADLVSLSEQLDTCSAAGKMMFRMLAVLAEFERDVVSERTKTAMQELKAQGRRVGTIPFGWTETEAGDLIENEAEQHCRGLISEMRRDGVSLRGIAKNLEDRGIPTKTGKTRWQPTAVRRILQFQPGGSKHD